MQLVQLMHLGLKGGVSISRGLVWVAVLQPLYATAATALGVTPDANSLSAPQNPRSQPAARQDGAIAPSRSWVDVTSRYQLAPDQLAPDQLAPDQLAQIVPTPTLPERFQPIFSPIAQIPDPSQTKSDPNRDRLLQPPPTPVPPSPAQTRPVLPEAQPSAPEASPATPPSPENPPPQISVRKIVVTGSTVLGAQEIEQITNPLEGRSATLEQLRQVADAITQLYLNQGYITSRAILVDQTITEGIVRIQVIEGSLEEIRIEGTRRLKPAYIRSRIELGAKAPLRRDRLEDQLRLLKADPLFTNVEASLRPGTQLGKSILIVRVTESKPWQAFLSIDNYSPPSVGSIRFGGGVGYRNVTGLGDELSASYFRSTTGGSSIADFSYQIPINAMNGTVQLRFSPSSTRITDNDFEALDITGSSQLYELSIRQPLIRTPRQELALSLGFTAQNGQTFLSDNVGFPFGTGPDADGNSRTRVFKFGQDYVLRDPQGAWAFRSLFSLGVGILAATQNSDPIPDGRFFSWLGQIQRVQRLGTRHLLIAQADLQLTPDPLLPSQQFVIGGGQSLRGFRQNFRSGDNGFRFSIEDRIALVRDESGLPTLQLAPFFDMGTVWNVSDNPNPQPKGRFLAGIGTGILWQPIPRLNLRLDFSIPLTRPDDRGSDAQDKGVYFSLGYQF